MRYGRFVAIGLGVFLSACASLNSIAPERSKNNIPINHGNSRFQETLEKAKNDFEEGKYNEAIGRYRKLLKNKDLNVVETSQYQIAYILAFYKNPKRDYQEALNEYQLFIKRFPESRLKEEAVNWVFLLNQYLTKKSENEKLRDDIKKLVDIDIEAEQKQKQLR